MVGWITPRGWDVWLFVLLGVTGAVAHLFMTWSLRYAPSATLAPMQYLEIPIATFVGLMIFGDLPNGLAALGILVTMAAGSTSSRASGRLPRCTPGRLICRKAPAAPAAQSAQWKIAQPRPNTGTASARSRRASPIPAGAGICATSSTAPSTGR
jgi:hypothetical protein